MSEPTHPAPGWYDDPGGPGKRYWDGTQWTQERSGTDEVGRTEAPNPTAWYARSAFRIGALAAGVVGVILLIVGVIAYLGSSDTRDEADEMGAELEQVEGEFATVRAETEEARAAAEELPALTADLDRQIENATAAVDATVLENNLFIACLDNAGSNQAFNTCVDTSLPAIEEQLAAELDALNQLQTTLDEAEEAVAATTGGGADEDDEEAEEGS